jgi:hypothetical protein
MGGTMIRGVKPSDPGLQLHDVALSWPANHPIHRRRLQ